MNEVRIGIIGFGSMGKGHANSIINGTIKNARLTALCDIIPIDTNTYKDQICYTDYKEMLASGNIDAVIIATPHYQHTETAVAAINSNIHTLLEKPISVHKKDCEKIIEAYSNNPKIKFAAMFNQRTIPVYTKIKEMLTNHELGDLRRINYIITDWFRTQAYYNSGTWRATWKGEGGGVLLNQSPHQLDLICWFMGMPEKVRAFCNFGKYHNIEVEDEVTAYMEYPNGVTGIFTTTTGEFPGTNRLEIVGDLGKLIVESGKLTWLKTDQSVAKFAAECPDAWSAPKVNEIPIVLDEPQLVQHPAIIQNFVNAILFDEKIIANGCEGIMSVELANAMLYSQLTNNTVNIPLNSDEYLAEFSKLLNK